MTFQYIWISISVFIKWARKQKCSKFGIHPIILAYFFIQLTKMIMTFLIHKVNHEQNRPFLHERKIYWKIKMSVLSRFLLVRIHSQIKISMEREWYPFTFLFVYLTYIEHSPVIALQLWKNNTYCPASFAGPHEFWYITLLLHVGVCGDFVDKDFS